jgi:hypothetical protein
MPWRLGNQREQHQLQILAAEFAAAREAVVIAEAAISAAAAPERTTAAMTMPVTSDGMPKLVEKRMLSEPAAAAPRVAVNEVMKMAVAVLVVISVAVAVLVILIGKRVMPVVVRMRMAEVAAKFGRIPFEMAVGHVKTVSHGSLPQE